MRAQFGRFRGLVAGVLAALALAGSVGLAQGDSSVGRRDTITARRDSARTGMSQTTDSAKARLTVGLVFPRMSDRLWMYGVTLVLLGGLALGLNQLRRQADKEVLSRNGEP